MILLHSARLAPANDLENDTVARLTLYCQSTLRSGRCCVRLLSHHHLHARSSSRGPVVSLIELSQ